MEVVQLVLSLIGIFGLMFLMLYLLKKLQKSGTISGRNLRVLERTVLDRDVNLFVVSVCGKVFLLGVTKANVTMLAELPPEYLNTPDAPGNLESFAAGGGTGKTRKPPPTFAEALAANLAGYLPKRKNKPHPEISPGVSPKVSENPEATPETTDCETSDPCDTCALWDSCDTCEADSCDGCDTFRSCDDCEVIGNKNNKTKQTKDSEIETDDVSAGKTGSAENASG